MVNIGYCCINISINEGKKKKDQITVNRGMTKKTFETKGLGYVSELTLQNIDDLKKIIEWNIQNNIFVYRM
jgi:UV DNA damage repair endonuclease